MEETWASKRQLTQSEKIRLQEVLNLIYMRQYLKNPCEVTRRNVELGKKDLNYLKGKN